MYVKFEEKRADCARSWRVGREGEEDVAAGVGEVKKGSRGERWAVT